MKLRLVISTLCVMLLSAVVVGGADSTLQQQNCLLYTSPSPRD